MSSTYGLSEVKNSEIRFRWIRLGLRAKWKDAIPRAVRMVTEQGRMKYLRPIYRCVACSYCHQPTNVASANLVVGCPNASKARTGGITGGNNGGQPNFLTPSLITISGVAVGVALVVRNVGWVYLRAVHNRHQQRRHRQHRVYSGLTHVKLTHLYYGNTAAIYGKLCVCVCVCVCAGTCTPGRMPARRRWRLSTGTRDR